MLNTVAERQNQGIKNSWSLVSFAKSHGKAQLGNFTNPNDGTSFKSLIFTNPETSSRTFVGFSSKLGELSKEEIAAQKADLQVVELADSGNYYLCKVGANAWEDVDII